MSLQCVATFSNSHLRMQDRVHLVESWDTINHLSPVHAMTAPQDVQACCQAYCTRPHGKVVNICNPGDLLTAGYYGSIIMRGLQ